MSCEIFIPVVYIVNLFIALSRLTSNVFDGAAELRTVKRAIASDGPCICGSRASISLLVTFEPK